MMDEFRQIPIDNDGKTAGYGEHIRSYDNDDPRYIKEDALSEQTETYRAKESFGDDTPVSSAPREESSADLSSASASSAGSVASSIGGSIGALAGVVATTVVAAVIVVAAFISTLTINLSLVMADMHSLVFEVEMHGAQEEDFSDPDNLIFAVLTADDGTRREQEIKIDTTHLTFDDLEPGKEYTIRIKNSEKTFAEKAYFTATKPIEKGEVVTSMTDSVVLVSVKDVKLGKNEYYTITVKDAQGNVVYSKDGVDPNAEYSFTMREPRSLFVSVAVNGKAFALSEIEYAPEPSIEPEPTVDPEPSVDPEPTIEPDEPAHEHTYGSLIPASATCEAAGMKAHYYCEACGTYFDENKNEASISSLTIGALGHELGSLIPRVKATSTTEANGALPHYVCSRCEKTFAEDGQTELRELTYCLTYDEPTWDWAYDSEGIPVSATATFAEIHGDDSAVLNANIQRKDASEADCENPAYAFCAASVTFGEKTYETDERNSSEQFATDPALGHRYGAPEFIWTPTESGYEATAVFTCSRDGHEEHVQTSVLSSDGVYEATAEFEGERYFDRFDPNVNLSFNDDSSRIHVTPTSYGRSYGSVLPDESETTPFVSSEYARIKIGGSYEDESDPINIWQTDDEQESSVYLCFDNLTVKTEYGANVMRVSSTGTVNVHISFNGEVSLSSGEGAVFYSEGGRVNVYLHLSDENADQVNWTFNGNYGGKLFYASSGEIRVYMPRENELTSELEWIELASDYEKKPATPVGTGRIAISDGNATLYSDGYVFSGTEYAFENTASNRYIVSGNRTGDNPLSIYGRNRAGQTDTSAKITYYLTFDNMTLTASTWASAFAIKVDCDMDIYVSNVGTSSIKGYNHPAFSLQTTNGLAHTVNIYVESDGGFDSFTCGRQSGSSPTLYATPENCTVNFYMNGVKVDSNGQS